jgi:hypothetical protein
MCWRLLHMLFLFNCSKSEDNVWGQKGSRRVGEKGKSSGEVRDSVFRWKEVVSQAALTVLLLRVVPISVRAWINRTTMARLVIYRLNHLHYRVPPNRLYWNKVEKPNIILYRRRIVQKHASFLLTSNLDCLFLCVSALLIVDSLV